MDVSFLHEIEVLPRLLEFSGVGPGVSLLQLRGVWGRVLASVSPTVFEAVFDGRVSDAKHGQRPAYALAERGTDGAGVRRVRWTLFGREALAQDATLCLAWIRAGEAGVGAHGRYVPFAVQAASVLGPDGRPSGSGTSWRMDAVRWPYTGDPARMPCRLEFAGGLCLSRKQNRRRVLVAATWPEIIRSAFNRLRCWLPETLWPALDAARQEWDEDASDRPLIDLTVAASVAGYSRRQENESGDGRKLYLTRVGSLEFPAGLGEGWPLMRALGWLGLGDHITEGMGTFDILPLSV